jgi:dTDP-4-amino-4,6-dideoxygalactose transaminase
VALGGGERGRQGEIGVSTAFVEPARVRPSTPVLGDERRTLYVPATPGLGLRNLAPAGTRRSLPFPLDRTNRAFFYRGRHAIYHLIRALRYGPEDVVLVPEYHSGNEVWAIRAAGARVRFYRVRRDLGPDLDQLEDLGRSGARALFVIHFLGWPQPIHELRSLCRRHGLLLIEDCALALLSETAEGPLGSFGDFAIFCLYKTLPIPDGGLLVQNRGRRLEALERIAHESGGLTSLAGRTAELALQRIRAHSNRLGGGLVALKRRAGRVLRSLGVKQRPLGEIGFRLDDLHLRMSRLSHLLMRRLDYAAIRTRRRDNFLRLRDRLAGRAQVLRDDLPEGICPLFFPILVREKESAEQALRMAGVSSIPFWNEGDRAAESLESPDTRFLRRHVLELPIHQDLTSGQIDHIARQALNLRRP